MNFTSMEQAQRMYEKYRIYESDAEEKGDYEAADKWGDMADELREAIAHKQYNSANKKHKKAFNQAVSARTQLDVQNQIKKDFARV